MKIIRTLLLLQFISLAVFAQKEITVDEMMKTMSKGSQNGYVTDVPQGKLKEVTSGWKKYVKRDSKNNIEEANSEVVMRGTTIPNISSNPIYVYVRFLETDQGVMLTAYFSEDDSVFISTVKSEEKSIAIKKFMKDFVIQQYKVAVYHEQDAEKKKLSKLENDLDDLIKANEKANKRINEDNRRIDKNKDEIAANRKEQEARAGEVANQKEVARTLSTSTGEEKDLSEKKLKNLEKEKKKLEKKGENLHKDVEDLETDIRRQQRNIEKNEDLQKAKKEDISAQKDEIRAVEKKLNGIK